MGIIKEGLTVGTAWLGAKRQQNQAKREKKERLALLESMDWQPMYTSQVAPTYQRTQSPVARSYLESFLMGSNPNATFSGSPNAAAVQAAQQRRENSLFGTPNERMKRQAAFMEETPWRVETPTRPVVPAKNEAVYKAKEPGWAALGLNQNLENVLKRVRGGDEYLRNLGLARVTWGHDELSKLLKKYDNDPDALAEAIRSGKQTVWGHRYRSSGA